jgi:hypothetical protein
MSFDTLSNFLARKTIGSDTRGRAETAGSIAVRSIPEGRDV